MKIRYKDFQPAKFSFHKDPVLALEEFWSADEREIFQAAMKKATWKTLQEMPEVNRVFPNCGNWLKAEIGPAEREKLLGRVTFSCIQDFIESFPNIKQRHMSFSYYSYGVGDSLSVHDDTGEDYSGYQSPADSSAAAGDRDVGRQPLPALRRIAMVSYLHHEWNPDWGGELIIYDSRKGKDGKLKLEIVHCLEPKPGSLVFFTVPRFHRVCRVDPYAGDHKRLSFAGWFMTEHFA